MGKLKIEESFKVSGDNLLKKVKEIIKEGNVQFQLKEKNNLAI